MINKARKVGFWLCIAGMVAWSIWCWVHGVAFYHEQIAKAPYAAAMGISGTISTLLNYTVLTVILNYWFVGFASMGITALLLRKQKFEGEGWQMKQKSQAEPPEDLVGLPRFATK
jgi:hypothetical protein